MKHVFETITGFVVLAAAAVFIWVSYDRGHIASFKEDGYVVSADFGEIGSLASGADVRVGGVKIGTVAHVSLEPRTYRPKVDMRIHNDVALPDDTSAAIVSDGLLGGKYVALSPGASESMLKSGASLEFTQDAVSLEALIGKFAFGGIGGDKEKDLDEPSAGDPFAEGSAAPSSETPQEP
ncbi:MAG: outer membrane lipid asymmetry maintenance protein MlaD [Rickettsiales bacterium]